jgi:hypothetical protein
MIGECYVALNLVRAHAVLKKAFLHPSNQCAIVPTYNILFSAGFVS